MDLIKDMLSNDLIFVISVILVGWVAFNITKKLLKVAAIIGLGYLILNWVSTLA